MLLISQLVTKLFSIIDFIVFILPLLLQLEREEFDFFFSLPQLLHQQSSVLSCLTELLFGDGQSCFEILLLFLVDGLFDRS